MNGRVCRVVVSVRVYMLSIIYFILYMYVCIFLRYDHHILHLCVVDRV